jgi:hypothetical protein
MILKSRTDLGTSQGTRQRVTRDRNEIFCEILVNRTVWHGTYNNCYRPLKVLFLNPSVWLRTKLESLLLNTNLHESTTHFHSNFQTTQRKIISDGVFDDLKECLASFLRHRIDFEFV